ncbi:hypothetical protein ACFFX0_32255 [Citricoccus parietis]|uniref:Uncharacterized protein n=1 Tax=Citricoccus parietis TaxID=592307 RepID=A0ABV5G9H3_9MICC
MNVSVKRNGSVASAWRSSTINSLISRFTISPSNVAPRHRTRETGPTLSPFKAKASIEESASRTVAAEMSPCYGSPT